MYWKGHCTADPAILHIEIYCSGPAHIPTSNRFLYRGIHALSGVLGSKSAGEKRKDIAHQAIDLPVGIQWHFPDL